MEFQEKFIAFIDILGFKQLVKSTEAGTGMPLPELLDLLTAFGSADERQHLDTYGPTVCPVSKALNRNLDFRLTQISDCAIISVEVSPAGVINLLHHCSTAILKLLKVGIMCRGYITRGKIYHTDNQVIGTGYQEAYEKESGVTAFKRQADERGTPFVEIDRMVCEYVTECDDPCVREMFSRFVKDDGVVVALFPFQRLAHSFTIAGSGHRLDPQKERASNQIVRQWLKAMQERVMAFVDQSNPRAVRKAEHYIDALNRQLAICDTTDEIITLFTPSVGQRP